MQQPELVDETIWHVDVTAALLIALLLQQDVIKATDLESNKRGIRSHLFHAAPVRDAR
jgi:hypothetical protein